MTKPLPEIRKTIILDAPVEKVWEMISTPEGIASWWMENNIKPLVGQKFILHTGQFGDSPCKVTAVEENRRIEFDWDKDWHISFNLKSLGNGKTQFTLVHSGWDAEKKTKFGQDHSGIREIMNGGWENNVMKKLPESIE